MSTPVVSKNAWEVPQSGPIDEVVWRSWVLKGLANERRTNARFLKAAKGIAMAALVAASVLWSQITVPAEVIAKFMVTAASVVVVSQAFRDRHYAVAAVFAAMVLMFNPVVRVFEFSGQWQQTFVAASAVLFTASFVRPTARLANNG